LSRNPRWLPQDADAAETGPNPPARANSVAWGRVLRRTREQKDIRTGKRNHPAPAKVLDADDRRSLLDAALYTWLTAGRYADEFETSLATRFGLQHSRLTVSGSAANLLAFSALTSWKLHERRILPGSEVITVAAGFPTTVAPIIQNQCVPVFVDVDLATANINIDRLAAAVGPKTRAIVLAHTLGTPFNLDAVIAIAKQHNNNVSEVAVMHGRNIQWKTCRRV
jgi:CDP-6-deoxy-D-xylo-4-hexulose-3-dehydrase